MNEKETIKSKQWSSRWGKISVNSIDSVCIASEISPEWSDFDIYVQLTNEQGFIITDYIPANYNTWDKDVWNYSTESHSTESMTNDDITQGDWLSDHVDHFAIIQMLVTNPEEVFVLIN
jgi:hypothetical protein|tara:strand:- start:327 stop:683 length:357 start_codon:yes stop_codon:yes gene_type:complete